MPMYDYKCPTCQGKRAVFLKLADLNSPVYCAKDGFAMNRQISAPFIRPDFAPYESPAVPGKWIEGRRQHEEHLRETGCRILEPGETQAYQRRVQQAEAQLDKSIEQTADQFISELPTDKRDRLAAEMEGGLDVELARSTPSLA